MADNTFAPKSDSSPAWEWEVVTPDDDYSSTWSVPPRYISVGTAGTLNLLTQDGVSGSLPSGTLGAGEMHPLRPSKILDTGTTATDIVAYW